MRVWSYLRYVVLAVVLGVFGYLLYARGTSFRLGGPPAAFESAQTTEEAWVVAEILRDLTEIGAAIGGTAPAVAGPATTAPTHRYPVGVVGGREVAADLSHVVWAPEAFADVARFVIGARAGAGTTGAPLDVYTGLTDLRPQVLIREARRTAMRLSADPADAAAHESAALVVGAFGLREAPGRYEDLRWVMNRMTAHLAVAAALRGSAAPSADGALAHALLLAFANRQREAAAGLVAIRADGDAALASWMTAVRLVMTDDWRSVATPGAASRLERVLYFRARRGTMSSLVAATDLDVLGVDLEHDHDAVWLRLGRSTRKSVQDSHRFVVPGLDVEFAEAALVRADLALSAFDPRQPAATLNAPAAPLVAGGTFDVLPWHAWAAQIQRHIVSYVDDVDRHHRHRIGDENTADIVRIENDTLLGPLRLYPVGAVSRTTGPKGGLADFGKLRELIALAAAAPELVPHDVWTFVEMGARYEPVRRGMPLHASWFMAPDARSPYQVGARWAAAAPGALEALTREAPYDYALAATALSFHGQHPPDDALRQRFGARLDYDARAIGVAIASAPTPAAQLEWRRRACAFSASECIDLADALVHGHQRDAAAAAYERAFDDPAVDTVGLANRCGWLVTYYFEAKRIDDALRLAERAADTGALAGLTVQAYLFERLGRYADAERQFARAADNYDAPAQLFGFYNRMVNTRHRADFDERWQTVLKTTFPGGRTEAPVALTAPPTAGVAVVRDSEFSRKAGVQAGDVIVGLEGWQVDSLEQYRAVNASQAQDTMRLAVWRGRLFEVTVEAPGRLLGVEFRNHPIRGWVD